MSRFCLSGDISPITKTASRKSCWINWSKRTNLPGYLGNCHSSGTVILDQLGEEHMKTGKPIFYTSADSVFQIACHEETFGLDKLYELCEIAREELTNGGYNIGRVIARPFIGDKAGNFQRTGNRHDLAVEPPAPTVLQKLVDEKHGQVVSVGKIADIYANCGITKKVKATGLDALFDATIKEMKEAVITPSSSPTSLTSTLPGATVATSPVMLRVWSCSTAVCRS